MTDRFLIVAEGNECSCCLLKRSYLLHQIEEMIDGHFYQQIIPLCLRCCKDAVKILNHRISEGFAKRKQDGTWDWIVDREIEKLSVLV